jgi:hypothetical protein
MIASLNASRQKKNDTYFSIDEIHFHVFREKTLVKLYDKWHNGKNKIP